MKILLIVSSLLSVASPAAMAHAGHVADESAHGPLHLEHVIVLFIIGVVVYLAKGIKRK